jgi:hypothetical protein
MLIERHTGAPRTGKRHVPLWLKITAGCIVALVAAGIVILATHWPFSRDAMTRALEEATSRPVQIGGFSQSYFPPGCVAENVRVMPDGQDGGQPLITIQKVVVQGSFTGMFTSPKRLARVKLVGMHLIIPPKNAHSKGVALNSGSGGKGVAISRIEAGNVLLNFIREERGKPPYRLKVDSLAITDVNSGKPMSYQAVLTNTEPPGVIRAQGKFGPWNPDNPAVTPVSGAFTYTDANLGAFHGINGTMQGKGTFQGPLGHIQTEGTTEVPGFYVSGSANSVHLVVGFHGIVNGTNGDTYLEPADARFLRTHVIAQGSIEDGNGEKGKTTTLALSVPAGRIEDILRLFVKTKTAPISGAAKLSGKFVWPPGPREFVSKIRLDLDFGIDGGRFTSANTQGTIDKLGKSGEGESKKQEQEDPRTLLSDLRGHVAFRDGVATFQNVSLAVSGASAKIHGTYNLVDSQVDLHGVLYTSGKLSDATSGLKAVVAKLITPFFKKKNDVKQVPFKITGTFAEATVSLD